MTLPDMGGKRKNTGPRPGWSKRLLACRKFKGLTQEEFAKAIGVSQQSYGYYEIGKNQPNVETWIRISDFTGHSIDMLMRGQMPLRDLEFPATKLVTVPPASRFKRGA